MPRQVIKSGSRESWYGLSAAVWVEIAAGNAYNFPLYSHALKSALSYNQQQLMMLGVANDIGESVSLIPSYTCGKLRPWLIILIGALLCFLGYGLIWLSVTKALPALPFWLIWFAVVFAANSNAWFGTTVLVTNMKNFPSSRGTVAGILKGYSAIGGAVYTVIYNVFLDHSSEKLLLFLALGIPLICFVMMHFIRPCAPPASEEDSSEHGRFIFIQAVASLAAIIVLTITMIGHFSSVNGSKVTYTLVFLAVGFLVSPFGIPLKMTYFPKTPVKRPEAEDDDASDATDHLLKRSSSQGHISEMDNDGASDLQSLLAEGGGGGAVDRRRRPRRGENFQLREALFIADFWLLWLLYFLGIGSGVTVLNNLAQVGIASGIDNTTVLLCLFSFCNFVGRLGSGALSEHFVRSSAMPRTLWMTVAQFLMVVAFILYTVSSEITLYIATGLLGTCYGCQYALMVPTTSELFGLEHFGTIYSFMILGNPIGAILFSGLLAGRYYDAEAIKQGKSTCYGPECFRKTFIILACVCGIGTIIGVILTVSIRPVYRYLHGPRSIEE